LTRGIYYNVRFSFLSHKQKSVLTSGVIPHTIVTERHGVVVMRFQVMSLRMLGCVPAAAHVTANQAYPQVFDGAANHAFVVGVRLRCLDVATNWAAARVQTREKIQNLHFRCERSSGNVLLRGSPCSD